MPALASQIRHESSCPLLESIERSIAADAEWFKSHPTRTERKRRTTLDERMVYRLTRGWAVPEVTLYRLLPNAHTREVAYRDGGIDLCKWAGDGE